jgi:subtilisin family serine protease
LVRFSLFAHPENEMKRSRAVLLAFACVCVALNSQTGSAQQRGVSVPVIVVFDEGTSFSGFAASYRADDRARANPAAWNYLDRGVAGFVQDLERGRGFRADHVYSRALKGFAARLTAQQIAELENDPRVAYVEIDGEMAITQGRKGGGGNGGSPSQTLPWGIDRIDADLSSTQAGNGSGTVNGVNAYIIDTGIDSSHADLTVAGHVNFAGGANTDCHGHGTHVAGTVGAEDNGQDVVGVAPGVRLYGVKVLGCGGSGTTSGVIKGVDWVTDNAVTPAIANMSLGGGVSQALDDAVIASAQSGVFYSLAAGNSGANACDSSPARTGTYNGVATTAATGSDEKEASWSNYGSCVDIWAPGVSILSTKKGGGTTTMSGTSMAAPHVGGGGALYLSIYTAASPAQVESALKGDATPTGTTSKNGASIKRLNVGGF